MYKDYGYFSQKPIKLCSTRVWRTYHGGKLLEEWQGLLEPKDSQFPEDWVASVVHARNPGREHIVDEGLSKVETVDGEVVALKQIIDSDPVAFLGEAHVKKYGNSTGVLVKLLDSAERLLIQVHPDRTTAKTIFHSDFGKTEAWYLIGGRTIGDEPPYILFGFKPGMTREKWERLFWQQDIDGMVDALHKFYIKPGQVFLIEGGIPHAIGPGCFLVEIQEPTDYTIRVERRTPAGQEVPDISCHQGAGFDRMFDCFHYETYTETEIQKHWSLKPATLINSEAGCVERLIGYDRTAYFAMNSITIRTSMAVKKADGFSIIIVVSGHGIAQWEKGEMTVKQGDQIFLPAVLKELICRNTGQQPLHLVQCFPPM